jgi:hypothetical protein
MANHARRRPRNVRDRRVPRVFRIASVIIGSIIASLSCIPFQAEGAVAGPAVQMSVVVGFSGWYGHNHWVPVTVTIHNSGKSTPANLVLDVDYALNNGRSVSGTMYWPVKLASAQDTTFSIAVPGQVIDSGSVLECQIGNHVAAVQQLLGNPLRNVALVAVLSSEPQYAQFLTGSADGATGEPVLPVAVKPDTLPTAPNLYDNLTAAVATPYALGSLTDKQQQALLTWVRLGGLLIVTGTSGTTNWWQRTLPFVPGKPHTVSGQPLSAFTNGGTGTQVPKVVSYASRMNPVATAWAVSQNDVPLVAAVQVGRGKIVQTAFLPTEPSLLAWTNNTAFWTSILKAGSAGTMSAVPELLDPAGVLNLSTAANTLSPMRVPSLGFWLSVFVLYALIVGPVGFYILRRYKKESFGWVAIPILSLVTTIGIWAFGASQRPTGSLLAGVGVIDLVGNPTGEAEAYGIQGFMAPIAQNIASAHTAGPMMMLPLAEAAVGQSGSAKVIETPTHATTEFADVGRWRVRYVYTAGVVRKQGQIQATLEEAFGMLSGAIENRTPYYLHNLAMYWQGHMFLLGDVKPGEKVTLTAETQTQDATSDWLSLYSSYNRDITRGVGHALGSFAASQDLLDSNIGKHQVLFVATTTDLTPALPRVSQRIKSTTKQTLVLIRQFANVSAYESGVIS